MAVLGIVWAASCLINIYFLYLLWGNAMLVAMFPEGRRWWMPWARLLSLAAFALLVLYNPIWRPQP